MRPTLTELANKHRTDKGTTFARGAHGPLGYAEHYDRQFDHLRDKAVTLLEIGVAEGGSLRMWREYFEHRDARIIGLDVRPVPHIDGCVVAMGSQSDPRAVLSVARNLGPFDIIIDDGSHKFEDQMASFFYLFHYLRAGGRYFIEDLQADFNGGKTREWFRSPDVANLESIQYVEFLADENIVMIGRG